MELLPSSAKPSNRSPSVARVEPRLPTLFGRLTELLSSHERQLTTLGKLREMCNALDVRSQLPSELEPSRLLSDLRSELSPHFVAEESEGHFGMIARQRLDLLPRVLDLKLDHAGLLRDLAHAELLAADENWQDLSARVSDLTAALEAHEHAEAELVRQFLRPDEDLPLQPRERSPNTSR
jgi:hypothetical protein